MKARMEAGINNKYFKIAMYIGRGALIGLAVSTVAVLLIALLAKSTNIADNVILIFNQIFKVASIFLSALFAVRTIGEKGWLYGALAGIAYVILGFLIFSLIDGKLSLAGSLWGDLLTGAVAGAISGMITMSLKKR